MKTKTTTTYITKLIVAKAFTYNKGFADERTLKAGTVLETRKHKMNCFLPWEHSIVMGYGLYQVVPLEHVKVKWLKETRTVTVETKEINLK